MIYQYCAVKTADEFDLSSRTIWFGQIERGWNVTTTGDIILLPSIVGGISFHPLTLWLERNK